MGLKKIQGKFTHIIIAIFSLVLWAGSANGETSYPNFSFKFIADSECIMNPSKVDISSLPESDLSNVQSIYSGCYYFVIKVQEKALELKDPNLIWFNSHAPKKIWIQRGGKVQDVFFHVNANMIRADLGPLYRNDTIVVAGLTDRAVMGSAIRGYGVALLEKEEGRDRLSDIRLIMGFCYAIIIMNIVTFISLMHSNSAYRYYVFYASSMLLFVESFVHLIPSILGLHTYNYYVPWWQIIDQILAALVQFFVVVYLECHLFFKKKKRAIPKVFNTWYFLTVVQFILCFMDINLAHEASNVFVLIGSLVLVPISFHYSFIDKRMSKLIFVGFLMPPCAGSIFILSVIGVIDLGLFSYPFLLSCNALEAVFFAMGTMRGYNAAFKASAKAKTHLLSQLKKIVYPHQLRMISEGNELETTMPTHSAEACVICFDIIGSSKIRHEKAKEFLRSVFMRCNELMMTGYDGENLKAEAYRIKEMGDGFLCSVGYPFKSKSGNVGGDALALSIRFYEAFREEVKRLGYKDPIHCSIGLAVDNIMGFYPESGTKEYDLYGRAIVLATRYEGMRKIIFKGDESESCLIIQERVYMSLKESDAKGFTEIDLEAAGIMVRDDLSAKKLYYRVLSQERNINDVRYVS